MSYNICWSSLVIFLCQSCSSRDISFPPHHLLFPPSTTKKRKHANKINTLLQTYKMNACKNARCSGCGGFCHWTLSRKITFLCMLVNSSDIHIYICCGLLFKTDVCLVRHQSFRKSKQMQRPCAWSFDNSPSARWRGGQQIIKATNQTRSARAVECSNLWQMQCKCMHVSNYAFVCTATPPERIWFADTVVF